MLLLLIIILILIWAAVIWSIYSNFIVFYSGFSESESYHKAYYASISALERAELVTKQRQPWYEWEGWSDISWSPSDKSLDGFSYLWDNGNKTSVVWTIDSLTNRIPAEWKWDVEWLLAYEDSSNPNNPENSNNYNMMDYENSEVFLLYYDNSDGNPYVVGSTKPTFEDGYNAFVTWKIRLPKRLKDVFWDLDTSMNLVWTVGDLPADDGIVDWQIRWKYSKPFVIHSTQSTEFDGNKVKVKYNLDSVFRESDINKPLEFKFGNKKTPIIKPEDRGEDIMELSVIGENADTLSTFDYEKIFWQSSNLQLRFSLLNLLQWSQNNGTYPFLEYYVYFWENYVPDKYWTITAKWGYKDYNVDTIIQKPTVKESIFWSFTSIF